MSSPSLSTLPPELLFAVLALLDPYSLQPLPAHPLLNLAATSRALCSAVEEYTRSLLAQHSDIVPPRNPKTQTFVCRKKWFAYLARTCRYCGKSSRRRAILDAGTTCCKTCDREKFPKVTMSEAYTKHRLSKLDLFTPNLLHHDLPPLTVGNYTVMGGSAVMICAHSIAARKVELARLLGAEAIANDAYMKRRAGVLERLLGVMGVMHVLHNGVSSWRLTAKERVERRTWGGDLPYPRRHEKVKNVLQEEWDAMDVDSENAWEKLSLHELEMAFGIECEFACARRCPCHLIWIRERKLKTMSPDSED